MLPATALRVLFSSSARSPCSIFASCLWLKRTRSELVM